MEGSILSINEKEKFPDFFNANFSTGEIYLKTKNGNFKIFFQGFYEGTVAFRIPFVKNITSHILVSTRKPDKTIYADLNFIAKEGEDLFLFEPVKAQVISISRKEDRQKLGTADSRRSLIYISNIITDFLIEKSFALQNRKTERLKIMISEDIKKFFTSWKIFFINEGKSDARMKYFYQSFRPIVIANFDGTNVENKKDYVDFISNIYKKDYKLINKKNLISEISTPLLFNNLIPFGYIQVNSEKALDEKSLKILNAIAQKTGNIAKQINLFDISKEKMIVSDLSKNGIGIVFKERSYLRYFNENSFVNFNLYLPDQLVVTILCLIRNITIMDNKVIKVGCEIVQMPESSKDFYEAFVDEFLSKK